MGFGPKNILVPLDPQSEPDFREPLVESAIALAKKLDAKLTLFAAIPIPLMAGGLEAPTDVARLVDDAQTAGKVHAERVMRALASRAEEAGVTCVAAVSTACTSAPEGIIAYAEENAVDLIVVNTHGRKGVVRWLLGSVAERVARGAPCEVLLLRPEHA